MSRWIARALAVLAIPLGSAALSAQGVTTSAINASVRDANGTPRPDVLIVAVHKPSGSTYQARTRQDGRATIAGMRVGGPYLVSAKAIGADAASQDSVFLALGVAADIRFVLRQAAVQLSEVTVTAEGETVFSSARTGAATSVGREAISTLPTITARIEDFARLTPQYSGSGFGFSFAGQDNRMNNVTVDGAYFNNSFGLAGQPGDRTGVAPISMDAIEAIQVAIAPFDVRQGNFVGAGVNTVTRSGTNEFAGSAYYGFRDNRRLLHGTSAKSLPVNPGKFEFSKMGVSVGGPIVKNRAFFFVNYESDGLISPGTTFRSNLGGEPAVGSVTRVLKTDLDALSSYLGTSFGYQTGPYQGYDHETPALRFLAKVDLNVSARNKVSLRYSHLDSDTDVLLSNSQSLGGAGNTGRRTNTFGLNFQNSNYKILENIRSAVGEWNAAIGSNMSNNMIIGYEQHDESRGYKSTMFPFVDILDQGTVYTSFGFEPFTPNNELRYKSTQFQNNFSIYSTKHDLTFGVSAEQYESENVFFQGAQSVYVYNTLADFYIDANDYLANPNRTVSPIQLNRFQVAWTNILGQTKPVQPLEVLYAGVYAQDQWRVNNQLRMTFGLRLDRPTFSNTAFLNTAVEAMNFRDESGATVKYSTGKMPDANLLFSPRLGFNWDVSGDRTTQIRGGSGVFTGRPAYVWISNQIGNNGVLTGFEQIIGTTAAPLTSRPFHPDPNHYKPATIVDPPVPAASYALALTEPSFRFPQLWRSNVGVDRRLPFGLTGTAEFLYSKDVNGVYYINANLPQAQSAFSGADSRLRWTSNRINASVTSAVVLKNQNVGSSWNISGSLEKPFGAGTYLKAAYAYGVSRNTVDPGSIAAGSWTGNGMSGDPNNPGVAYASTSPGHRLFVAGSYRRDYFRIGPTTAAIFWETRTIGSNSYTYAADANGDAATNDLIYIPRDISEMNFVTFTTTAAPIRTFTAAEQAAAWETYIQQDDYLSSHRGRYVERNGVFLPMLTRADFSVSQEIGGNLVGRRNSLEVRLDFLNFGNLLNKNWGVSQRLISTQPLTNPGIDGSGRMNYRLRVVNGQLMRKSLEQTSFLGDVYRIQLGVRYNFN